MMSQEHYGALNQWQYDYLFNRFSRVTTKEISKLYIIGPLWGESTGDLWIRLTKGQ